MVMGAYARKHYGHHQSVECETNETLQILWDLWKLCWSAKVL